MYLRRPTDITPSTITPQEVYDSRRAFIKHAGLALATGVSAIQALHINIAEAAQPTIARQKLSGYSKTTYGANEKLTSYEDVTTYNNYYEFGTDKTDPARSAHTLRTRPWTVAIEGAVKKNKTLAIEDIMKLAPLEERIYRMRCVEAWSMVIPWIGLPLAKLIEACEPTGNAKFVEFITLADPKQMPSLRPGILDWPYNEGLRIDEAMHPLSIMAVGLYGEVLPNQNGAPMRLVVPWKYGFKSAKSIVKIRFTETMPQTAWVKAGPREYGFYSNVNPSVDHPRWSQATERRIGSGVFAPRIKTLPFNGYADQVAQLYTGMDLSKFY